LTAASGAWYLFTVDVDIVDEVRNFLFGDLKSQSLHDGQNFFGRDTSVIVFVKERERFSQTCIVSYTRGYTLRL